MATNPFIINVADALHGDGMPVTVHRTGQSPSRVGPEMIAIPEGQEIEVDATITPLGSGVLVDASVTAQLKGECVRCLKTLTPTRTISISQVFEADEGFIVGDEETDEDQGSGDEIRRIEDETVDLEQAFVDEAGLTLPFNPTCEPQCEGDTDVPDPDGISGEENNLVDPRWADLEKFL